MQKKSRIQRAQFDVVILITTIFFMQNNGMHEPFMLSRTDMNVGGSTGNTTKSGSNAKDSVSVSGNPGAANIITGTGSLGRKIFKIKESSGWTLGGLYIGDGNLLLSGGVCKHALSGNSLLILSLTADLEKICNWCGGLFGIDFLQFNGMPTNQQAGVLQGYNGLPASPPFNRSELYELWFRQEFFDKKLNIRIGKSVPNIEFNNVLRPASASGQSLSIPATTSLIYTPIFVDSSMLGVLPGYYNSVYGIVTTFSPSDNLYFKIGLYDGNLARGIQTGLKGPHFNDYIFSASEIGLSWQIGSDKKRGTIGIGTWLQTGKLTSLSKKNSECGAQGFYLFGSQRLWLKNPGEDNSGILGLVQFGINNSITLPVHIYLGLGVTALGLIPKRENDSFGIGSALGWLNKFEFNNKHELILQGYYQAYMFKDAYFLGAISYIPKPALPNAKPNALALTARMIFLF